MDTACAQYTTGEGVPQDYAEAAKWYRKAAGQGNIAAQLKLSEAYSKGEGVPQDSLLAYVWASLSAAASTEEEHENAVAIQATLAKRLSAGQIADARRQAQEWKFATPK